MVSLLYELFEYNNSSNKKYINAILVNNIGDSTINMLMSHIINAHKIWLGRLQHVAHNIDVWQIIPPGTLHEHNDGCYHETLNYLNAFDNDMITQDISYKNSKGDSYTNKVNDILMHIINHSTYHRAQMATHMRAAKIDPPNTDYIFYKREA